MRYNPKDTYFTEEKIAAFFDEEAGKSGTKISRSVRLKEMFKRHRKHLLAGAVIATALSGAAYKVAYDVEHNMFFKRNLEDVHEELRNQPFSLTIRTSDGATHGVEGSVTLITEPKSEKTANLFSTFVNGSSFTIQRPKNYQPSETSESELACDVAANIGRNIFRVAHDEDLIDIRIGYNRDELHLGDMHSQTAAFVVDKIYLNGEMYSTENCE